MKQKIKKLLFYGTWLLKYSFLTVIFLIVTIPLRFSKKYKNLWLISERPDEARDNGYWLYKWILENHPETNVRYVLSRKSTDYAKMPRKDLIVTPNSPMHYICHILSSYSVSTHMHGACPGKSFCIPFLFFMRKKKNIFLQHGITKNAINLRGRLDAIIAASEQEKTIIAKANPRYQNKIYVAGFCRYDFLKDESKGEKEKIILIMPTFRKWLRDIGRLKNSKEVFRDTDYYRNWQRFLNSKEISQILKNNQMRIIFCPHKEMQELCQSITSENERIKISKPGEFDVQELLKKSSILITDYSSVFYDFVYMDKPVIFYQFDNEEFYSKHYQSSGEPYPFGRTFTTAEDVVRELGLIVESGAKIQEKYKEEIATFYKYRDRSNCKRVFNLIKELK